MPQSDFSKASTNEGKYKMLYGYDLRTCELGIFVMRRGLFLNNIKL